MKGGKVVMWIRSKNRKVLIEVNNVFSEGDAIYAGRTRLGVYGTEARAMEVLDEIQLHVAEFVVAQSLSSDAEKHNLDFDVAAKMAVYEMPQY
jgi:hypothetical protein